MYGFEKFTCANKTAITCNMQEEKKKSQSILKPIKANDQQSQWHTKESRLHRQIASFCRSKMMLNKTNH